MAQILAERPAPSASANRGTWPGLVENVWSRLGGLQCRRSTVSKAIVDPKRGPRSPERRMFPPAPSLCLGNSLGWRPALPGPASRVPTPTLSYVFSRQARRAIEKRRTNTKVRKSHAQVFDPGVL